MYHTNNSHGNLRKTAEILPFSKGKAFNDEKHLSCEDQHCQSHEQAAQAVAVATHGHEVLVVVTLALQVDYLHLKYKELKHESNEESSRFISNDEVFSESELIILNLLLLIRFLFTMYFQC